MASSSSHYSLPANMIKAGRGINMVRSCTAVAFLVLCYGVGTSCGAFAQGDGWETIRNRPDTKDGGKSCALFILLRPSQRGTEPSVVTAACVPRARAVFSMQGPLIDYNWTVFRLASESTQLQQVGPPSTSELHDC